MKNILKNVNIYRIVWVSCIFLLLIAILVMVMDYKIHYEYLEESFLYFYNCDSSLCASSVENANLKLYSKYECMYQECPQYERVINTDYALLRDNDNSYELYNYKTGNVISAGYDNYYFINNGYIVVHKGDKQGIIDIDDNIIVALEYDQIGCYNNDVLYGYNLNYIVAKKKDKYGIISFKDGKVKEDFVYSEERLEELIVFLQT